MNTMDEKHGFAQLSDWTRYATIALALVLAFLIHGVLDRRQRNPSGLPLPPTPPKLPLLGNMLQLSGPGPFWVTYSNLAREYGEMFYLSLPGSSVLVLNSLDIVKELLDQRSSKYSDRSQFTAVLIAKAGWNFSLLPYGPWWRAHRRSFHQHLNEKATPQYRPIVQYHILKSLHSLLNTPDQLLDQTRTVFGNIILHMTYGTKDERYMQRLTIQASRQMQGLAKALDPAHYLVNIAPLLRFVPSWFPGAGWKRELEDLALSAQEMTTNPFEEARERMKGEMQKEHPSLVGHLLDQLPPIDNPDYPKQELIAQNVAVMAFIAGAESTVGTASCIILALAMYPEVQKRAQQEIDTVVGPGRLPDFEDIPRLPYLQALIKEAVRLWPVTPVALPHAVSEDDVYRDYFIPKGTIVMANVWAIFHDPKQYPSPEDFHPERFLKDGQIDPNTLDPESCIFGFGRRICPGQHLSQESLSMWAACLLAVFNVLPALDEAGSPVPLKFKSTGSINSHPERVECRILPRSSSHASLLEEARRAMN